MDLLQTSIRFPFFFSLSKVQIPQQINYLRSIHSLPDRDLRKWIFFPSIHNSRIASDPLRNYGNLISEKKCGNNDSKKQIASNKKQNQNIDEDTNSFGALNFVRNTILAACFLLPRALHTQNFLPSLRLSLLARKKKKQIIQKKLHKNKIYPYQRNRSCSSLPTLIYLFICLFQQRRRKNWHGCAEQGSPEITRVRLDDIASKESWNEASCVRPPLCSTVKGWQIDQKTPSF
jgi:hypothetical protein